MADLSAVVRLRCTEAEARRWRREAAARGVTVSDLIRQAVEWRLSPEGERDARAVVQAMARRVGDGAAGRSG